MTSKDASGRGYWILVPGRPGNSYKAWLKARGDALRAGIEVSTLDPFHGCKNAIDDQLEDATAV